MHCFPLDGSRIIRVFGVVFFSEVSNHSLLAVIDKLCSGEHQLSDPFHALARPFWQPDNPSDRVTSECTKTSYAFMEIPKGKELSKKN